MWLSTLRRRSFLLLVFGVIAFISSELSYHAQEASAIPAFARKYGLACNVCHVPGFPKLNDFGNLFRDHGYQLGADQDLPTFEGITMGFWPVSFRTTVGYQSASLRVDGGGVGTGSFGFTGLDILSYGLLHRNISFGVVYTPGLGSAGFGAGSTAGQGDLESAFVRLNNLERFLGAGGDSYLANLKVGKYELDVPFSEKRSQTLNTKFVMYHYQAGTPYSAVLSNLTASRYSTYANPNTFAIGDNQPGAELAGIKPTAGDGYFRYSLNVLSNSNQTGPLSGCPAGTTCGTGGRGFDFYGHVTQSFGGYGIVTGHRIGLFGAYGSAPTRVNAVCPTCAAVGADGQPFSRIGVDLSTTFDGQWNLFGAWMHATDSKPLFASQGIANAQDASWNGAFVQLDWYPTLMPILDMPGWLVTYRYDLIRNTRQGNPTFATNYNDVDSHTWMARYYIHQSSRTDIAWHAEYNTFRALGVGVGGGDQVGQTMLLGLDFAF
ncbi:MAG: hypothetical protein KGI53_07595 [Nitrospirota bacterium]|nr:hypothetical protein [Nitrospirota bacterium]